MSDEPLTLIKENTTRPVHCDVRLIITRLNNLRQEKYCCRLYTPHDGPHKAYIDRIGWHAWGDDNG